MSNGIDYAGLEEEASLSVFSGRMPRVSPADLTALIAKAKEADKFREMLVEVWTELGYYAELKDMYDFTKAPDDDEVDVDVGDVRKLAVFRARIAEALK